MAKITIIGDSLLKGTIYNEKTGQYEFTGFLKALPNSKNLSKFGCTITKGSDYIRKVPEKISDCRYLLMNFGVNDGVYNWKAISDNPLGKHELKTPPEIFESTYVNLIRFVKSKNIIPVVTTICPINCENYFAHFCKALNCNPNNVMTWLKNIEKIGENGAHYSEIVRQIAKQEQIPLIDIRNAFLKHSDYRNLFCCDGIHPNCDGQNII